MSHFKNNVPTYVFKMFVNFDRNEIVTWNLFSFAYIVARAYFEKRWNNSQEYWLFIYVLELEIDQMWRASNIFKNKLWLLL